ncbi:MAG: sulfate adenylyltransferase subunit CysN [Alphaproteobacteria bacterium]|nr:sulfate adenylyltransferase subunit CysN [Alphaproteobacteria bacterium]
MAEPARAETATESASSCLLRHEQKGMLRFLTCGSVDDGKSTLIGRLLYDSKALFDDQMAALEQDSRRFGTTGEGAPDFALLVDGLQAEREQGITIDVAYRFFATERRAFIIADTPGHEQYTRNTATGASTADAAVLLVDARKGLLPQTMRHSVIVNLMGIRHLVLAVNKMDLVGWNQAAFDFIASDYKYFVGQLGVLDVTCIPVSALTGDNIVNASKAMPWYSGPSLLEHLESVDTGGQSGETGLRFPVQWVCRPNQDFRGYAGTVAAGAVRPGDAVAILPSGRQTRIANIVTMDGNREEAGTGEAVTLTLEDEVDVARGDVIAAANDRPEVADQFAAHVVWMSNQPLLPGRTYQLQAGTVTAGAQVTGLKYRLDVNSLEQVASRHLDLNDIGMCNLALDRPIPFDPYKKNRTMGGFILIDRISNETVACGMIEHALRRASNIHPHHMDVDKTARAALKGQRPCTLWFTGLSGAGKSTIANLLEQRLHAAGRHTYVLDGDNLRGGLNRNLGFTAEDRVENIRRVAECAKLFVDSGLIVLVALISPFRAEREMARSLFDEGEFMEIFIDTPMSVCEDRDPKGLYRKARAGLIPNFTGIGAMYECPETPDVMIDASAMNPEEAVEKLLAELNRRGVI